MCEKCRNAQFDAEKIYREQVEPLLEKAHAICKENGIPLVASCCFRREFHEHEAGVVPHTVGKGGRFITGEPDRFPQEMAMAAAIEKSGIETAMKIGGLLMMKRQMEAEFFHGRPKH